MHVQRYLCRRVHYGPSGPSVYVDGGDQAGGPDVRGGRGSVQWLCRWGLFKCRSVYVELVHVSLWSQQHWNTYLLHSATVSVLSIKQITYYIYIYLISDAINICINLGIAVCYSRRRVASKLSWRIKPPVRPILCTTHQSKSVLCHWC